MNDPIALFLAERARAVSAGAEYEGAAAVLATATPDAVPSARFVLVKEVGEDGFFVYTNYTSRKARELDTNPRAALCFHWPETGVQFRIEGPVERATDARSDAYFASRPRESRIGAWASDQSAPIASRDVLLARYAEAQVRFGDGPIARPPGWGGYRIVAERIEHWVNGEHRLHDRVVYVRGERGWETVRLAP
jgi:pyridoxamine 5'-phosphate oxidase